MFTRQVAGQALRAILHRYWFQLSFLSLICFGLYTGRIGFEVTIHDQVAVFDAQNESVESVPTRKIRPAQELSFNFLNDEAPLPSEKVIWSKVTNAQVQGFIKRFAKVAKVESRRYGIPVSVILGNGLIGSRVGQSPHAVEGNNYFGLPCLQAPKPGCYERYPNAWESFRAHSRLLAEPPFRKLDRLEVVDYQAWALGLEQLGFPQIGYTSDELIAVIEQFKLYEHDY